MTLDHNRPKTEQLNIRMSEDTRSKLEDLAADLDVSMSSVVTVAIRRLHGETYPAPKKTR